jgi:hypothetical protein
MKIAKPFMHFGNFDDDIAGQGSFIVWGWLGSHKISLF